MEKMWRYGRFLCIGTMLLAGLMQVQTQLHAQMEEDTVLFAQEDGENDGATRSCIKRVNTLVACTLTAQNANITNARIDNLTVVNNETIGGNLRVEGNVTIEGDLIVEGNYVPLTIPVQPGTDTLSIALNGLSTDAQNFGSVILQLAPGTYDESGLYFTKQIQDVTIVGDTHPLAGVAFMQGGIYGGPLAAIQGQLNIQIGRGCNYDILFDATGTIMTVNASASVCSGLAQNPQFDGLVGYTVLFRGTNGVSSTYTVEAAAGNTMTFNNAVAPIVAGTNTLSNPSDVGVAFIAIPNVTVNLPASTTSSITGIKNLKIQGIEFVGAASSLLFLGGVNTKMELSNNRFDFTATSADLIIAADLAYNRQPNAFVGSTTVYSSAIDFVFNTIAAGTFVIQSSTGSFSGIQGVGGVLSAGLEADVNASFSRLYNTPSASAVIITQKSNVTLQGSIIANVQTGLTLDSGGSAEVTGLSIDGFTAGTTGIDAQNGSFISHTTGDNLTIKNFTTAFDLQTTTGAILPGSTIAQVIGQIIIDINTYTGFSDPFLPLSPVIGNHQSYLVY